MGTPDVCEIRVHGHWQEVGIEHALAMDRAQPMRCPACHGRVKAHKAGTTGQRAHFEHFVAHAGCPSKPHAFSGTPSRHPHSLD